MNRRSYFFNPFIIALLSANVLIGQTARRDTGILNDAFWFGTTMGMEIYQPPNVAGWWHGSPFWTGSQQWLARINFASSVAWRDGAFLSNPAASIGVQTQLDGVLSAATAAAFAGAHGADPWYVIVGSPEFQLK